MLSDPLPTEVTSSGFSRQCRMQQTPIANAVAATHEADQYSVLGVVYFFLSKQHRLIYGNEPQIGRKPREVFSCKYRGKGGRGPLEWSGNGGGFIVRHS